jgi:hypothetical protein
MSTTPFRTAFWALGLALAMTVILLVPSPQRIRSALRAHRQLPHQKTLFAALPRPHRLTRHAVPAARKQASQHEAKPEHSAPLAAAAVERVAEVPVKHPAIAEPVVAKKQSTPETPAAPEPVPLPIPVRVASADLTAPLGLTTAPREAPRTSKSDSARSEDSTSLSIPVPEPLAHSQREMEAPKPLPVLAPPMPPVLAERIPVPESGAPVVAEKKIVPAPFPEVAGPPAEKLAAAAPVSGRYSFQFEATPIADVLREIGQQAGWSVIVDPAVQGRYTGEFLDADPAQVFALVVKSYNCSVHRRGAFLLIGSRPDDRIR